MNEGLVQAISHALVGIYDYAKTKRVYICPTNLENNARLLGITDLNEPDAMYAVMLHEGAHAIADRRFGLRDFLAKAMEHDEDAGLAADAMVEGYAQYVARQICTKTGKLKGLESFTRSISAIPPLPTPANAPCSNCRSANPPFRTPRVSASSRLWPMPWASRVSSKSSPPHPSPAPMWPSPAGTCTLKHGRRSRSIGILRWAWYRGTP